MLIAGTSAWRSHLRYHVFLLILLLFLELLSLSTLSWLLLDTGYLDTGPGFSFALRDPVSSIKPGRGGRQQQPNCFPRGTPVSENSFNHLIGFDATRPEPLGTGVSKPCLRPWMTVMRITKTFFNFTSTDWLFALGIRRCGLAYLRPTDGIATSGIDPW